MRCLYVYISKVSGFFWTFYSVSKQYYFYWKCYVCVHALNCSSPREQIPTIQLEKNIFSKHHSGSATSVLRRLAWEEWGWKAKPQHLSTPYAPLYCSLLPGHGPGSSLTRKICNSFMLINFNINSNLINSAHLSSHKAEFSPCQLTVSAQHHLSFR